MAESVHSFESMVVEKTWSLAVFEATNRFDKYRPSVLVALGSPNGEIRSAAVATLNEANDQSAHDEVIALINDSDPLVQDEVLEYLVEFAVPRDAEKILRVIKEKQHLFIGSLALNRLYPHGPVIYEDDSTSSEDAAIAEWEAILSAR